MHITACGPLLGKEEAHALSSHHRYGDFWNSILGPGHTHKHNHIRLVGVSLGTFAATTNLGITGACAAIASLARDWLRLLESHSGFGAWSLMVAPFRAMPNTEDLFRTHSGQFQT